MFLVIILIHINIFKEMNTYSYPIINYSFKIKSSNTFHITVNHETNIFVKINKKNGGYDERHPNENKNFTQLNEFKKNLEKKILLNILTNDNVSRITKIDLIKNNIHSNNIYSNNILAGGLMKDFEFKDF